MSILFEQRKKLSSLNHILCRCPHDEGNVVNFNCQGQETFYFCTENMLVIVSGPEF